MRRTFNQSPAMTFPGMSNAVLSGDLLFIAGQVALGNDGSLVGDGDPRRQAEQCFKNVASLAELAGANLHDVVRLTCYLADPAAYSAYAAVKAELFPEAPPAGTAVVVNALLDPRFLLEVEATLVLRSGTSTPKEPA